MSMIPSAYHLSGAMQARHVELAISRKLSLSETHIKHRSFSTWEYNTLS